jgi:hypothetical protein
MPISFRTVVFVIAFMATLLAMGGALAHAYELPRKMGLSREDYFTVQQIYAGWDKLAFVLIAQLLSLLVLAWLVRGDPATLSAVVVGVICLIAAQFVFWTWTFPANKATDFWTSIPENWRALRHNWEYSHLAGAVFQFIGAGALMVAALSSKPGASV